MSKRYAANRTAHYDRLKQALAGNTVDFISRSHPIFVPILEIGVGKGEMQYEFARRVGFFGGVYGQDIDDSCLSYACTPVKLALPEISPLQDGYRIIFCAHVLEHLADYDTISLSLQAMRDNLRPDGIIVVVVPDYLSWGMDFWDVDCTHRVPFTKRRMEQWVEHAGLRVVRQSIICGVTVGWQAWAVYLLLRLIPFRRVHARVRRAFYAFNRDLIFILTKEV